jgi:hypothetical protein
LIRKKLNDENYCKEKAKMKEEKIKVEMNETNDESE